MPLKRVRTEIQRGRWERFTPAQRLMLAGSLETIEQQAYLLACAVEHSKQQQPLTPETLAESATAYPTLIVTVARMREALALPYPSMSTGLGRICPGFQQVDPFPGGTEHDLSKDR